MPEIDHQTRGAIGCPQAGTEPCSYPDCKCHQPRYPEPVRLERGGKATMYHAGTDSFYEVEVLSHRNDYPSAAGRQDKRTTSAWAMDRILKGRYGY